MLPLQSPEIDKLTQAFVEARKSFKFVREDNKANYGKYVSLEEIKACTNEALLANGLSLTQKRTVIDKEIFLVTKLTHVSGQWECSYVPLIIHDNPKDINQAYGAALSYQRRYELYGLFSIKGEENDPDSVQEDVSRPANNPGQNVTTPGSDFISVKQLGMLKAKLALKPDAEETLYKQFGSLDKIPWKKFNDILGWLDKKD
jgi:hypothetical protein